MVVRSCQVLKWELRILEMKLERGKYRGLTIEKCVLRKHCYLHLHMTKVMLKDIKS